MTGEHFRGETRVTVTFSKTGFPFLSIFPVGYAPGTHIPENIIIRISEWIGLGDGLVLIQFCYRRTLPVIFTYQHISPPVPERLRRHIRPDTFGRFDRFCRNFIFISQSLWSIPLLLSAENGASIRYAPMIVFIYFHLFLSHPYHLHPLSVQAGDEVFHIT